MGIHDHASLPFSDFFLRLDAAQPVQVVRRHVRLPWRYEDWRDLSGAAQDACLDEAARTEREAGFDLRNAPLMRVSVVRLRHQKWRLLWTRHHVVADGWSLPIVMGELLEAYSARRRGVPPTLPPALPYQRYIEWLARQDVIEAHDYWRRTLRGFDTPTVLGFDQGVSGDVFPVRGWTHYGVSIGAQRSAAIQALAKQEYLTSSTVFQGIWAILLARYSGEQDVVFGSVSAGRPANLADSEGMVGCFLNTLPVRVHVDEDCLLLPWLNALKAAELEREQYGYIGLSGIHGHSDVAAGAPLFSSLLVVENYPISVAVQKAAASAGINSVRMIEQTSFPLTISVVLGEETLLNVNYARERFGEGAIEMLIRHFLALADAIIATPHARLASLSMLSDVETSSLVDECNATDMPFDERATLHQLVVDQVARTPAAVALIDGVHTSTYSELLAHADVIATSLRAMGVGPGARVGVGVARSANLVEVLLGVLLTGAAYVPIDLGHPADRLRYIIEDARPILVIGDEALKARLTNGVRCVTAGDLKQGALAITLEQRPDARVDAGHIAYVIYTSGSTGSPKGVQITHRNAVAFVSWALSEFSPEELAGTLAASSICFDLSIFELFAPLACGGTVILAENALALPGLPARERVTLVNTVPSAVEALLCSDAIPKSVRVVNLAGEALSRRLVNRIYSLPWVNKVNNLYGPTEDTTYSTLERVAKDSEDKPLIGRPIANKRAYVLDKWRNPAPLGVAGELYLSGAGVAAGYLQRAELTADRFSRDPFDPRGTRWMYRTGDIVRRMPDGRLDYLGRVDRQIKLRGFRVELGEIETALLRADGIADAAAIVLDEPGGKVIVAYFVGQPEAAALLVELGMKLPYYMIPARLRKLPALPLTANGKVDYRQLAQVDAELRPLQGRKAAPATEVERQVATIWEKVIGVEQIGLDDAFFEIGGSSLHMAQVQSQINALGHSVLAIADLFRYPTVRTLAAYMAASGAAGQPVTVNGFDAVTERLARRRNAVRPYASRAGD